jgi:crotonobetainyl-CoA:carnitine CoA-transferase CaiB-like acyl-CoA transferase
VKLGGILPLHDRRAPWLGEDTTSVLTDLLGLDDERLAHLRAAGVIG